MAKQKETKFKEYVLRELKKLPRVWFVKIQMVSTRGIPDILMCVNGKFVAWELKVGKGKATKLQHHTLEQIRHANGEAYVVNPQNIEAYLNDLKLEAGATVELSGI